MILDNFIETKQKLPLLNYMQRAMNAPAFRDFSQQQRKKRLMKLVQGSPEAMAIVRGVVNDIVGKYNFEPASERRNAGRNKIIKASAFNRNVKFKKILKDVIFDVIITGEGYIHMGKLSAKDKSELFSLLNPKTEGAKRLVDEDLTKPRFLRQSASTTMSVLHDDHDVVGYVQRVGGVDQTFDTKEIIRITFENLDGKVEGFSPFISLPLHLELLWLLWQNQFFKQNNGNHPDLWVNLEDMGIDSNSPSYKLVEQTLKGYNTPGSPTHGHLLTTGKVSVTQMERSDSLEFKEVDQYVTQLIAAQWQYPMSRMGIKTEQAAKSKDSGGSADRGYWLNIEQMQDMTDLILNTELWEPGFGVRIVHRKGYLHDDVVEGTAEQLRLGNVNTKNLMLQGTGFKLKKATVIDIINGRAFDINEDDLEKDEAPEMPAMPGQGSPAKPKDEDLSREKRSDELNREKNTGKPDGV